MERNYQVYIHTFPNGKRYVGCSVNPKARWGSGHGYNNNKEMLEDILLYGWNNIDHEIMFCNLTKAEAQMAECLLIVGLKTYDPNHGYNKSQGSVEGVNHHSPEGISRISKAMSNRIISEESRRKMSESKKGTAHHTQKHTEETKKLISERRKGKTAKENHPMAKPVYCVELDKVFPYAKQAEEETGVLRSHICQVCKGKRKTAGKMHWRYHA